MSKTLRTQNFRAPRLSWYSFGDISRPFQPSHLKNHEFHFFTKLPTKPSTYAAVHRQPWPCAKPSELKTFVHQDFHGIHLGAFLGHSNPHISKTTNFIFSQNSPPSHLAIPWCTDKLSHVQNPTNSKLLCTKTFMIFSWRHLEANPTLKSQNHEFYFYTKLPANPSIYAVAMCKTLRTQNFRAPRISWYSFGDIWRPLKPSHLKNHEFHFFTKLPTKPSTYAVVHRQPWPCAKPSELKTFVHQEFHGIQLGTFGGLSNTHISKITNFIFSQNTRPSNLVMPWCTDQLGLVQNPTNSKLLCTETLIVFILGHFEANPTLTCQKPRISFFHKTPHQAI